MRFSVGMASHFNSMFSLKYRLCKTEYLMSDYICPVVMQLLKTDGVHMFTYRACLVTLLSYAIL